MFQILNSKRRVSPTFWRGYYANAGNVLFPNSEFRNPELGSI